MKATCRLFTILFIILFIFSCKKTSTGSDPIVITFPDANLETLWVSNNSLADLNSITNLVNLKFLHIAGTNTTNIDNLAGLVNLTSLYMFNNQIVDISPLSGLVNLTRLNMFNNQIVDISPLVGLVNLQHINLNDNQVTDLLPFVNNAGIDSGDEIWLENNLLSNTSINTYIPALEARGVIVHQ